MKTAVLVPSHIYYSDQLERLDRCLKSLRSQTSIPDIFVSISFENDTYKREFSKVLRNYPSVTFKLSSQQKFQMEHLFILSHLIDDYDMIMFCDDDDTYLPIRVERFIECFKIIKEQSSTYNMQFGGVREVDDININNIPEYWAYGIVPSLLIQFFKRIRGYENLMCHKFADMYFRNYLRQTGGNSIAFGLLSPSNSELKFYEYTIDNPNSICARHSEKKKTAKEKVDITRDLLTLCLINRDNDQLKEIMSNRSVPLHYLNKFIPDIDHIKKLTSTLYI
jgi:hypothetical protein